MKNVVLIGMPGTGKSTVGVILAKRLGYGFLDTDILLAETEHRKLPEIIADKGYEEFIRIEGRLGASIEREKCVIATGGSMVFSENAMENLCRNAVVVWLDTPVEELEKRLVTNRVSRGVAAPDDMTVADIYEQRKPLYERCADYTLKCAEGTDNVVDALLKLLEGKI